MHAMIGLYEMSVPMEGQSPRVRLLEGNRARTISFFNERMSSKFHLIRMLEIYTKYNVKTDYYDKAPKSSCVLLLTMNFILKIVY